MEKKILIILAICVVGFFLDDLAMRTARIEYRDVAQTSAIKVLQEKLHQAEERIRFLNPLSAKLNVTSQRLGVAENLLAEKVLLQSGIGIFRTSWEEKDLETASIGSNPLYQNTNWGGVQALTLGGENSQNQNRALIKFKDVKPGLLKNKKILAAVLYLRQIEIAGIKQDDGATNETINVYAVVKKWNKRIHRWLPPITGEVSWISNRTGEENWTVPGCGSEGNDFEPEILATSGAAVSGGAKEKVALVFTPAGIEKLQMWIDGDGRENQGFLLKLANESKPNTFLFFDSWLSPHDERPYMKIYYSADSAERKPQ